MECDSAGPHVHSVKFFHGRTYVVAWAGHGGGIATFSHCQNFCPYCTIQINELTAPHQPTTHRDTFFPHLVFNCRHVVSNTQG